MIDTLYHIQFCIAHTVILKITRFYNIHIYLTLTFAKILNRKKSNYKNTKMAIIYGRWYDEAKSLDNFYDRARSFKKD